MRSKIQDSHKKMKEIGVRLIEIERIRYQLRRTHAPKEAFLDLDRRHRGELDLLKMSHKHFAIGIAFALFLVALGISCGTTAMISFRNGSMVVGLIMATCSASALYLGEKQILG